MFTQIIEHNLLLNNHDLALFSDRSLADNKPISLARKSNSQFRDNALWMESFVMFNTIFWLGYLVDALTLFPVYI